MRTLVSSKVFFTWTITSALVLSNVKAANYGEQCQSSEDCVSGTTCSSNICECDSSHFYDESSSQCNIRVGMDQTCDMTITNERQCSKNGAHCAMDSEGAYKCLCKPAYYFDVDLGSCIERKGEGENCYRTENCIENAECVDVSGGRKECKCSIGYKFTQSTSTCSSSTLGGPVISVFFICMTYLMGVFITSVFN